MAKRRLVSRAKPSRARIARSQFIPSFLLLEDDGSFLLLEDDGRLMLEK